MAHIEKFKAAQVVGVLEHNARTDETRPHAHTNEDIDPTRTKDNYELHARSGSAYAQFKQRLSEVQCMKRDDVTVLDSLIVTLPKDVKPEDERAFFEGVYAFACKEYGAENIVNATVHKDETSPHIHIGFIPVVEGKRRNGEPVQKVNHSSLITKTYLDTLHPRLSAALTEHLGYECAILNGATENGNKTILQLKNEQRQREIEEKDRKIAAQDRTIKEQERTLQQITQKVIERTELGDRPPLYQKQKPKPRLDKPVQAMGEGRHDFRTRLKDWENEYSDKAWKKYLAEFNAAEDAKLAESIAERERWDNESGIIGAAQAVIVEGRNIKASLDRRSDAQDRKEKEFSKRVESYENELQAAVKHEVEKILAGTETSRERRLEAFCDGIELYEGMSVLGAFEQDEKILRQELDRKSKRR